MPDSHQPVTIELGNILSLEYKGIGTFVEIKNRLNGEYFWCDPWITQSYPIKKDTQELNAIRDYLNANDAANKLKGILVSHTHGDHFADVPAIMAELGGAPQPPRVFGDANVQSLLCQYFATDPRYAANYSFYSSFRSGDYHERELSVRGDIQSSTARQDYGLVFHIQDTVEFSLPDFADRNAPGYFFLRVTPLRWEHSKVPDVILGKNTDLSGDPGVRTHYVTDAKDTTCPCLYLFGFVVEVYRLRDNKPDRLANFALIPGIAPVGTASFDRFIAKTGDWAVPFDHYFYVPCSKDFVEGNPLEDGRQSKKLNVDGGRWNIFHTADGTE